MAMHAWVNLTYTPVEVQPQDDGSLHTFTTELAEEIAREEGAIGCYICGAVLTTESFDSECEGAPE